MLKSFYNIGIKDEYQPWLKDRISTTNKVFLLLNVIILLNILTAISAHTSLMIVLLIIALGVSIFAEILVYLHSHLAGRIVMSTLPVLISVIIQGAFQQVGGNAHAQTWVFIILFQSMPFVLFSSEEKIARYTSVAINIAFALNYELFNQWIELDKPLPNPFWEGYFTFAFALLAAIGMQMVMDGIFQKSQQGVMALMKNIEKEKEEQRKAQIELNRTLDELKNAKLDDEKRTWMSNGLADFLAIMRKESDMEKLYDILVPQIVKYIKANQAGLFVYHNETKELKLVNAYAYSRKKYLKKSIMPGEGLVGQCFLEKEKIFMTKVPNEYIEITSGLGEANPNCILLVPLINNEVVEGILEIAAFHVFEKHEIEYLDKIAEALGSFIANTRITEQTQKLLIQSQEMTEQMRSQEEEMRQNMEEMQATQEEYLRKEQFYLQKIKELGGTI